MTNQITHFGIMGGLYNRKISGRSSTNRATSRLKIPAGADAGLRYMKLHNLLSRNPLGSGGVGRMFNIRPRGSGLGNVKPTTSNLGNSEIVSDASGYCDTKADGGCGLGGNMPCCFYQCQSDKDCSGLSDYDNFKCYGTKEHRSPRIEASCNAIFQTTLKPLENCAFGVEAEVDTFWRKGVCDSGFCPAPRGPGEVISKCPDPSSCYCGTSYNDVDTRCNSADPTNPVKRCKNCGRVLNECGQDMSCITYDASCSNV